MRSRALLPLAAAALSLAGSLAATITLHRAASGALDRELDERLRGAGASAALFFGRAQARKEDLAALVAQNGLDGAYVVDRGLVILADAFGPAGRKVDLLRADPARVEQAFRGEANVGLGFELGELRVGSGYFPIRGAAGVEAVLALEAGRSFVAAATTVQRARDVSVGLSVLAALALAVVAARWARSERERRAQAERAARGEALTRVAAAAAHEIRNPLGIIRGTVELMRERLGAALGERDRTALADILGEVDRLRRLTEDLMDLAADRPLASARVDLTELLEEAARAAEAGQSGIVVRRTLAPNTEVSGDPGRLRQVVLNLLVNAAQAQGSGELSLELTQQAGAALVRVRDRGPGVPAELRAKLFEPFVTGKATGTGLGLAVSRRLVERHGGALILEETSHMGTSFLVRLPLA